MDMNSPWKALQPTLIWESSISWKSFHLFSNKLLISSEKKTLITFPIPSIPKPQTSFSLALQNEGLQHILLEITSSSTTVFNDETSIGHDTIPSLKEEPHASIFLDLETLPPPLYTLSIGNSPFDDTIQLTISSHKNNQVLFQQIFRGSFLPNVSLAPLFFFFHRPKHKPHADNL